MKKTGEIIQVLSVRPGGRVYSRMFKIIARCDKAMILKTQEEPKITMEIEPINNGILHSDQLMGPPTVTIKDIISGFRWPHSETSKAYFYDLGDNILLITI